MFVIVGVHACHTRCVCVVACGLLSLACTTPKQHSPQATSNRETKGGREMMEEAHKGFDRGEEIQRDGREW